jgi:hypothetical protein
MSALAQTLDIQVRDVAGQRPFVARGVRPELSVGDFVGSLTEQMNLPRTDSAGLPHAYHAYLGREARHLYAAEKVGDALRTQDQITLHPDVQAG